MPTYEYECGSCGHRFEKIQSITENPSRKCPACKRLKAKRLLSGGGGVIFKGSGFYERDYRSESYRKEAKKEKETASSPAETSSDSSGGSSSGSDN
jgi:putative FmdB family regulatory protein